jgi:hypothetical protein
MSKSWLLGRRTFLRGLGTVMALPVLDAMLPSIASTAKAGGAGSLTPDGFPRRMGFIYSPNGVNMDNWFPTTMGTDYEMPITMKPAELYRDNFMYVTGLNQMNSMAQGDGGGDHARSSGTFLTGCHVKKTGGANIKAGISVDQVCAQKVGQLTPLPSLELSCDIMPRLGGCDSGYSCIYQYNMSWASETMPLNPEVDPRKVFQRLFGDTTSTDSDQVKARQELERKSILDYVLGDAKQLSSKLGAADNRKMDQYLTSIREIERRIDAAAKSNVKVPDGVSPPPMFEDFQQHIHLMYDMIILALQTDSTRIFTFCQSHEGGNRAYPFAGVNDGHHDMSHHNNDPVKLAKCAKIDLWHAQQFAYFMEKITAVKEGNGSLLDNCMIVYGSGLSNGSRHLPTDLPIILCGKGGGTITSGRAIAAPKDTPLNNLFLSFLDRMGAPTERMGDSTGKLEIIA